MNQNKKSQAAIFMVVAIVVLLGGALFFYVTQRSTSVIEPEIQSVTENIPLEFDPVRSYANNCVSEISSEGLKKIGNQGGYISFTDSTLNKEVMRITANPTESDAVSFTRDSDLKIPYWWYMKSANNCQSNCQFASRRPDLRDSENSIEKQLERYINVRFKECLNGFQPFREQGYTITEEGPVNSDVTITSQDVAILIQYPIKVGINDETSGITQFTAQVPVNLNNIYELATKITDMEIKHHYLEKHVLNLIVAFSGLQENKLPPMSEAEFKFGNSLSWSKTDVKNKITSMLSAYIPLFQVDGTYNYDRNYFDSELKQRLYDSTILPVANSSFSGLEASFTYLDFWPAYFDLNCQGDRCAPSSANSIIPFIPFGIQTYRFAYDLSFPVLVEINDPFALNSQGYKFNIFLEGNIRNNEFMDTNFRQLETLSISERSQLCDVRTSEDVTINVKDSLTRQPLDDAQILYTLIGESCFIGATTQGMVTDSFPIGIGGAVSVIRENYIGKAVEFDANINTKESLDIELNPIFTKKVIVKKKNVAKTANGWKFIDEEQELNDKEQASITLTRINSPNELDFSTVAVFEGQQAEDSEVQLAPGEYSANIDLLLNQRIIIPASEKCYQDPKKLFLGKECTEIPEIDFGDGATPGSEQFQEGGLRLNFTVGQNDLAGTATITLYVISIDLASVPEAARDIEDLEQLGKIEEYSSSNQPALQPKFK